MGIDSGNTSLNLSLLLLTQMLMLSADFLYLTSASNHHFLVSLMEALDEDTPIYLWIR